MSPVAATSRSSVWPTRRGGLLDSVSEPRSTDGRLVSRRFRLHATSDRLRSGARDACLGRCPSVSRAGPRAVAWPGGSEREPLAWPARSEFVPSGRSQRSGGHDRNYERLPHRCCVGRQGRRLARPRRTPSVLTIMGGLPQTPRPRPAPIAGGVGPAIAVRRRARAGASRRSGVGCSSRGARCRRRRHAPRSRARRPRR